MLCDGPDATECEYGGQETQVHSVGFKIVGVRRCFSTGLMLPNVWKVDRRHRSTQLDMVDLEHREFLGTDQERSRCFQPTGGFMMGDRIRVRV